MIIRQRLAGYGANYINSATMPSAVQEQIAQQVARVAPATGIVVDNTLVATIPHTTVVDPMLDQDTGYMGGSGVPDIISDGAGGIDKTRLAIFGLGGAGLIAAVYMLSQKKGSGALMGFNGLFGSTPRRKRKRGKA